MKITLFFSRDFGDFVCPSPKAGKAYVFPENGLHPERQQEVADEIIAESKNMKINVQTHSECILLRLQRRMVETTAGTLTEESLGLCAGEVEVVLLDIDRKFSVDAKGRIHFTPQCPELLTFFSADSKDIDATLVALSLLKK